MSDLYDLRFLILRRGLNYFETGVSIRAGPGRPEPDRVIETVGIGFRVIGLGFPDFQETSFEIYEIEKKIIFNYIGLCFSDLRWNRAFPIQARENRAGRLECPPLF